MPKTITRADIVSNISKDNIAPQDQITKVLETVLDEMNTTLAEGDDVKITSFGTFLVRSKKPRVGRNPKTGEEATISARQVVTFRASPILKHQVANSNTA